MFRRIIFLRWYVGRRGRSVRFRDFFYRFTGFHRMAGSLVWAKCGGACPLVLHFFLSCRDLAVEGAPMMICAQQRFVGFLWQAGGFGLV